MKREEVIAKVSEIVEEALGYEVKNDEKVFSREYMDSLDMLDVVMNIEKEFNITIEDDVVNELASKGLSVEELSDELISRYELQEA